MNGAFPIKEADAEWLMCARRCWCNPKPALGICTVCLHKEIERQDAEIDRLRAMVKDMREVLSWYAEGKMESCDPYCSVWEGWEYYTAPSGCVDKRPIPQGKRAREVLAKHTKAIESVRGK